MAMVTIPKRSKLISQLVSSVPLLGPAIDAIVSRRKNSKKKGKNSRSRGVTVVSTTNASRRRRQRVGGASRFGNRTAAGRSVSVPENRLIVNSAPMQINMGAGTSTWKFVGKPQAHADYDADRGIRIMGGGLGPQIATAGLASVGLFGGVSYRVCGPTEIDARLAAIAKCFSSYAIRELRVTYIPQLGAGGAGGLGNAAANQLFFGLLDNVNIITEVTTPTQILELDPSMMVQSTGTQSLFYEHRGTKLWSVDITNESDNAELYQFVMMALCNSGASAIGQVFGSLYFNYVVDLYGPSVAQSNIGHRLILPPSSDVKDEDERKAAPPMSLSFGNDLSKLPLTREPPSPTKSLLAQELRSLRAKHFQSPSIKVPGLNAAATCATS